jgi:hypothetical protein
MVAGGTIVALPALMRRAGEGESFFLGGSS